MPIVLPLSAIGGPSGESRFRGYLGNVGLLRYKDGQNLIEFECDNQDVERELVALYNQAMEHGACFNPGMKVISRQGNLGIASGLSTRLGDMLIGIPEPCLPPFEKFNLYVADDDICIRSYDRDLLNSHVKSFEHMINVFNYTKKIAHHRASSLWFAFSSVPTLVHTLARGRGGAPRIEKYLKYYHRGEIDALLLLSFLYTRILSLKSTYFGKRVPVLVPFIDLVNHNFQAQGFQRTKDGNTGLAQVHVNISKAMTGSNECFVRYGNFDSLDAYLVYNFVDDSAPFVRSIPLEMHLSSGLCLKSNATIAPAYKGPLPPNLRDLRTLMPRILGRGQNSIEVTHLVIPGGLAPYALRRVLAFLIGTVRPGMAPDVLWESVQESEAIIVAENKKFYGEINSEIGYLRSRADYKEHLSDVERIVTLQMSKIEKYESLDKELTPIIHGGHRI